MAEVERVLMNMGCCRFIALVDDEDAITDSLGGPSYRVLATRLEVADAHRLAASVQETGAAEQAAEALGEASKRVDIPADDQFYDEGFTWHCRHEVG